MWVVSGEVLVAYLALVTVLMLTPGPDMLFVLASGVRSGSRAGFVAAVGVAVGETIHLLAAAAGLAALFRAAPLLYDLVRFAGAAYLLWLGLRSLAKAAGVDLNTADAGQVGFYLGPRLNAGGRIGEHVQPERCGGARGRAVRHDGRRIRAESRP